MNSMTEDEIRQCNNFIKNVLLKDYIVERHLCRNIWISGTSIKVHPITISPKSRKITLQWKSHKRVYDSFINRIVRDNPRILKGGYFSKLDGSCPSEIVFLLNDEIKVNKK